MKKLILSLITGILLFSLVSASVIYSERLSLSARDKDGSFKLDGENLGFSKASLTLTAGATLPDVGGTKQMEQSRFNFRLRTQDKSSISLRTRSSTNLVSFDFSDDKIVVVQEARLYYTKRVPYERNGKIRYKNERIKENINVKYKIFPDERKVVMTFNLEGEELKIVFNDIRYRDCIKPSSGRMVCTTY